MSEWMGLPGPKRFVRGIVGQRHTSSVIGVRLPGGTRNLCDELVSALDREIRHKDGRRAEIIRVGENETRSPAHIIGIRGGGRHRIRMTEDLLEIPGLSERRFIVQGVSPKDWRRWLLFLGQLRHLYEASKTPGPAVIFLLPCGISPEEEIEAFGRKGIFIWQGVANRIDSEIWAFNRGVEPQGICERLAMETSISLAGGNRELLGVLLDLEEDDQIDPREVLKPGAAVAIGTRDICWEEGLVDIWEGCPHVDTLGLLALDRDEEVRKRIWRAHSRVLFPVIDEIRCAMIRRHLDKIEHLFANGAVWQRKKRGEGYEPPVRKNPFQLEIPEFYEITNATLSRPERDLYFSLRDTRRNMAHMEPADIHKVRKIETLWEKFEADFPQIEQGWNWPRCGQTLTIMIGPAAADKSTWARRHFGVENIVSFDKIREETGIKFDHQWVFAEVGRRVSRLLAAGKDAVIDATQLTPFERKRSRELAARWVPIRYVVIDRPLANKTRDGGSQNTPEKEGMIEEHARVFESNLSEILNGDGVEGVEVINLMETEMSGRSAA